MQERLNNQIVKESLRHFKDYSRRIAMANARGVIHNLIRDEKKAKELAQEFSGEEMGWIAWESKLEYGKPLQRLFVSREKEIEKKLKALGFDEHATAANPMTNIKPAEEILFTLLESGGENDNSYNIIFIQNVIRKFTIRVIERLLKEKEDIAKQKSALLLLQEKRLKEEEELIVLQLEKINYIDAISSLKDQKNKLDGAKSGLERDIKDLRDSIEKSSKEESEKRVKLQETTRLLEEKSVKFAEIVAKHKAAHIDFDCSGFTVEQLEQCSESALQGWRQTAAVINNKLQLKNELEGLKSKRTIVTLDESHCNKKLEEMQKERKEDLDALIKARDVSPEELKEIKKRLILALGSIKKKQVDVKNKVLEVSGFHAATNSDSPVKIQDDYAGEINSNENRKLEVKPVAKSFKSMKIRQGMQGDNEERRKAFENLSCFFSKGQPSKMETKTVEAQSSLSETPPVLGN